MKILDVLGHRCLFHKYLNSIFDPHMLLFTNNIVGLSLGPPLSLSLDPHLCLFLCVLWYEAGGFFFSGFRVP